MNLVYLEEVEPSARTAALAKDAGTILLALRGDAAEDEEGLRSGDVFAVAPDVDAEPGDLVVWWSGKERTQALARVQDDLAMKPVGGFPPPPERPRPKMRGVVIGRLRAIGPAA